MSEKVKLLTEVLEGLGFTVEIVDEKVYISKGEDYRVDTRLSLAYFKMATIKELINNILGDFHTIILEKL